MQVAILLQGLTALQHNLQCIQHYITNYSGDKSIKQTKTKHTLIFQLSNIIGKHLQTVLHI